MESHDSKFIIIIIIIFQFLDWLNDIPIHYSYLHFLVSEFSYVFYDLLCEWNSWSPSFSFSINLSFYNYRYPFFNHHYMSVPQCISFVHSQNYFFILDFVHSMNFQGSSPIPCFNNFNYFHFRFEYRLSFWPIQYYTPYTTCMWVFLVLRLIFFIINKNLFFVESLLDLCYSSLYVCFTLPIIYNFTSYIRRWLHCF